MKNNLQEIYEINMTVLNDDGFLSPYSQTDTPVISYEVAEFLENAASNCHVKQKLALNVHSDCIDDEEKILYGKAVANYFSQKVNAVNQDIKRNLIMSVIFTVIGIIGLTFMIICDRLNVKAIWVECIDIFAWVFIWEAVDQFFIERNGLIIKRRRYANLSQMNVCYKELPNQKTLAEATAN